MSFLDPRRLFRMKPFIFFTIILLIKSTLAYFVIFDGGPSWTMLVTEIPFFWLLFCVIEWFSAKRKLALYVVVNLLSYRGSVRCHYVLQIFRCYRYVSRA